MRSISAAFALTFFIGDAALAADPDPQYELSDGSQKIAECVANLSMAIDDRAYTNHRQIEGLRRAMLHLGLEHHREIGLADEDSLLALIEETRLLLARDLRRASRAVKRDYYARVVTACEETYVDFRDSLRSHRAALRADQATGAESR